MASPTHGQPRVIRLGPRPRAAADDAHRPGGRTRRVRHLAAVPAAALLVVASLLWPFLVLAPLAGAGPDQVRLVQDDDTADLGVAYGPGGAGTVTAGDGLVVDQVSAALLKIAPPGLSEPGTVLDPSALAASGIPEVALRAYEAAAASLAASDPGCALPWWLLAGIGRVESNHGRFAGAVLLEDGTSSPPVIGIPLDGRDGVALITDSDDGLLDGDTTYDRAVGPMQFIPTTWAGWQSDGDGDGRADPHDVHDAALAAGRYLCGGGADLSTEDGLRSAVFRYNHSDAYVDLVLAIGRAYASGAVPVLPAGDVTAPTPTPTTSAPVPTTTAAADVLADDRTDHHAADDLAHDVADRARAHLHTGARPDRVADQPHRAADHVAERPAAAAAVRALPHRRPDGHADGRPDRGPHAEPHLHRADDLPDDRADGHRDHDPLSSSAENRWTAGRSARHPGGGRRERRAGGRRSSSRV